MVLWSEEKSKKDGLDVLAVGNVGQEQNMEEGRGGRETLADKPLDFENPVWQRTWPVIGSVCVRYY